MNIRILPLGLLTLSWAACTSELSSDEPAMSESDDATGAISSPGAPGSLPDDDGEMQQPAYGGSSNQPSVETGGTESTIVATGGMPDGSGGVSAIALCNPSGDNRTPLINDEPTTFQSTGFEDGSVDPFVICTTRSPNYGRGTEFDGRNVLEFHWEEEGYDGSRMTKGAEACGGPRFHKEGWYGFQFYLPDPGFPKDKTQGIAQIFALGGCSSWASKLRIDDNDLMFSRRGHCGTAVDSVIAQDIERNVWHSVVIHFVTSQAEEGLTEVWLDEDTCDRTTPTYRAEGINYGFGEWDTETDSLVRYPIDPDSQGGFREFETNEIEYKIGMYTFDNNNYSSGETRTLYYDNVSMLAEEGDTGFMKVNPSYARQ